MKEMPKPNPVAWFEIYVDDIVRARKFYEGVLQRKLSPLGNPAVDQMPMEMWSFDGNSTDSGVNGALVKMEGFPAGRNSVIVYFHSPDCKVEESRVEKHGGKVHQPKMSIGEYGYISLVVDTEGNMIGLHSMN